MDVPYSQLTHRGQIHQMAVLADIALRTYDLPDGTRRTLVRHIYNTLFRVTTPTGERYALRIVHPRQTSPAAVRSEVAWLAALREESFLVPEPVPNRDGETVFSVAATHTPPTRVPNGVGSGYPQVPGPGVPEPRLCILYRWVEGRFLRETILPSHLFRVGVLTARLHEQSARWQRPAGFTRHRVDNLNPLRLDRDDNFDAAVADEAVRLVTEVGTAEQGAVVAETIRRVWEVLRALRQEPDGNLLIHADLHQWNYLFRGGEAGAIDFDDCGFGPWLYDHTVTLNCLRGKPNYADLRAAFLAGYRRIRPLTTEHEARIVTLMALRDLQDFLYDLQERRYPATSNGGRDFVTERLRPLETFVRSGTA